MKDQAAQKAAIQQPAAILDDWEMSRSCDINAGPDCEACQ